MIEKTFISSESHLRDMILFIKEHLKTLNVADRKIKKIHVIAEEVLTNIISYAYNTSLELNSSTSINPTAPPLSKTVTVKLKINDKKELTLHFIDKGKSFDFYSLLAKSSPMTKPTIGGVGIYLIQKFADSVEYTRHNNKNILTVLIKNV